MGKERIKTRGKNQKKNQTKIGKLGGLSEWKSCQGEGEDKGKEGKGGKKARLEGGKCAKKISNESFSGMSNPSNTVVGSKSGVSEGSTVKKRRF